MARDGVRVRAEGADVDRDRASRLRAVDEDERSARVRQVGDRPDRQHRTGRPADVRQHDEPRPIVDRPIEGGERGVVIAAVADVDQPEVDPAPVAQREEGPQPPDVLERRRDRPIARFPVEAPRRDVHRLRRRMRESDRADVGGQDGRQGRPGLGHPLERIEMIRLAAPTEGHLVLGELRHRARRLARQRADRPGVQVDARVRRRQRLAHGRQLLEVGHEGRDHGSV